MSLDIQQQLLAWVEFIDRQRLMPEINPLIANSWRRCWPRFNPYQNISLGRLNPDHLLATQVSAFELISLARPIMEDIYQFIEQSDTLVALVNSAGYILDVLGDASMAATLERFGISTGGDLNESRLGTNAFSLALTERVPASVVGAEHYLQALHGLADAAAPVFELSGRLLGAIGVITPVEVHHPHTLGLAVAAARAIEGQRQTDYLLAEQHDHLAQLNTILAASSEGILVWDQEHILMRVNRAATQILGLGDRAMVGRRLEDFLEYPIIFQEALEKKRPLNDIELTLKSGERSIRCLVSLQFISTHQAEHWVVVTLRPEKDVRQLIQQQVGAQAQLTLEDIPGESAEMRKVYRIVRSAANTHASILIRGEPGTGKNMLASAIHNESYRREGPFFIFSCSSIPNELVISELLGYDQGFSRTRPGGKPSKFELAQGGTLYFQDVDALPLETQTVLLNVLDMGLVMRLGSDHPIPVDVRVIASTSVDIERLIAQGNFRADLFYRLGTYEILIPSLRERLVDLPVLVERILRRLSRQHSRPLTLAPEAMELLRAYGWPGNVRELEAVLGRAVLLAGVSEVIVPLHLPDALRFPRQARRSNGDRPEPLSMIEVERQAILHTAELCQGNVTEMASVLRIGRTTLWRKMKEFNITAKDFRRIEDGG